jgi:hypothetical protein
MHNIATILRYVRITVHQDEILQSGRKTYYANRGGIVADDKSFLASNCPRQTKFKESK